MVSGVEPKKPDPAIQKPFASAIDGAKKAGRAKIVRKYGLDIDKSKEIAAAKEGCDNKTVNCSQRPANAKITQVMIHNTVLSYEDTLKAFNEPDKNSTPANRLGASSHYLIREDGQVFEMVPEEAKAWHAGAGSWNRAEVLNNTALGIELVNPGYPTKDIMANCKLATNLNEQPAYTKAQIDSLVKLLKGLTAKWDIPPYAVFPHSDYKPVNRCDPGVAFPFERLGKEGFGTWVEPTPVGATSPDFKAMKYGDSGKNVFDLKNLLRRAGYSSVTVNDAYDDSTRDAVHAFQMRQRKELLNGSEVDFSTYDTLARFRDAFEDAKRGWAEKHGIKTIL